MNGCHLSLTAQWSDQSGEGREKEFREALVFVGRDGNWLKMAVVKGNAQVGSIPQFSPIHWRDGP